MAPSGPSPEPPGTTWRIACLGPTAAGAAAIAAAVSAVAPDASVEVMDFRTTSGLPEADLFVIEASTDPSLAIDQLQILRARGAAAPAIVVGGDDLVVPSSLGAHEVVRAEALGSALPNALHATAARVAAVADRPGLHRLLDGVNRTQQLIAAGEIARRVKHDINNPLAALLAEAQLLEMEDLGDGAREAAARIVELTRRVIEEVRRLEGPRGGSGT